MININFKRKKGYLLSFKIEGHAGYAEEGYDIVCSAVSAVSQTTLIGFLEVLKVSPSYSINDGYLSVNIKKLEQGDILKCQVLMETMLKGMLNMQLNYGDYIKVTVEEV